MKNKKHLQYHFLYAVANDLLFGVFGLNSYYLSSLISLSTPVFYFISI